MEKEKSQGRKERKFFDWELTDAFSIWYTWFVNGGDNMEEILVVAIVAIAVAMYLVGIITGKMLNRKKGDICSVHVVSQITGIK